MLPIGILTCRFWLLVQSIFLEKSRVIFIENILDPFFKWVSPKNINF